MTSASAGVSFRVASSIFVVRMAITAKVFGLIRGLFYTCYFKDMQSPMW